MTKRLKKAESLELDRRIWEARLRGLSQPTIAATLGVDTSTVSRRLKKLHEKAIEDMTERVAEVKVEQHDQLGMLFREAVDAWERSKAETKETKTIRKTGVVNGAARPESGTLESETKTTQNIGDPRFLEVALKALTDQRRIWGAESGLGGILGQLGEGGGSLAGITFREVEVRMQNPPGADSANVIDLQLDEGEDDDES